MKNNSILLIVIILLIIFIFCINNNKSESYINFGETNVIQKAQNSKFEKSQQLTPIGVVDNNNDNPLDYDICKKNYKNINDASCNVNVKSTCDLSINNDNNIDKVDCDKHIKCCKDKTCSCDFYLNNYGNETLFSDVRFYTGVPCVDGQDGWNQCVRECDGRCVEFGMTGGFYCFPREYASIKEYPVKTIFQKQSFRPA